MVCRTSLTEWYSPQPHYVPSILQQPGSLYFLYLKMKQWNVPMAVCSRSGSLTDDHGDNNSRQIFINMASPSSEFVCCYYIIQTICFARWLCLCSLVWTNVVDLLDKVTGHSVMYCFSFTTDDGQSPQKEDCCRIS